MLDVEAALAKALASVGLVPKEDAAKNSQERFYQADYGREDTQIRRGIPARAILRLRCYDIWNRRFTEPKKV